jgi:hypothetical protein
VKKPTLIERVRWLFFQCAIKATASAGFLMSLVLIAISAYGLLSGCGVRSFICSSVTGPLRPRAAVELLGKLSFNVLAQGREAGLPAERPSGAVG